MTGRGKGEFPLNVNLSLNELGRKVVKKVEIISVNILSNLVV